MSPQNVVRIVTFAAVAAVCVPAGFGQARGGASPPAGGSPGGAPGAGAGSIPGGSTAPGMGRTTPNIPNIPNTPTNPNNAPQRGIQQPIFISGRVMTEDGTPPPQFATIESVCGSGMPHAEGYTDGQGYFSIELGKRNAAIQDASESASGYDTGMGGYGGYNTPGGPPGFGGNTANTGPMSPGGLEMRLANCELRARLAGYRSQTVSLATRRPMDNPDIGVILLHRLVEGEGSIVSANTLNAPKNARKAFDKGNQALKKRKADDAMKNYQKAVAAYPDFAAAWYEIGRLQLAKGDKEGARTSFNTAAKADPKYVSPLVEIAALDVGEQNWPKVVQVTDQASKLDSFDYPQLFLFNAVANYNMRNIDAAEKSARKAEKLDTRHQMPKTSQLLGIILAQRRDYAGAAEAFKSYLKFAPQASDADTVRKQLDQIEKMTAQSGPPKQDH